MNSPLVTIITPVYNGAATLAEAIQSVLDQTYTNWELLIVNDGSTDNSEEIVLSYKDDRIHYFKQGNKGVSAARNVALDKMKGDYFCFLDADDLLSINSIESRLSVFNQNNKIEFVEGIVESFKKQTDEPVKTYYPDFKGNPFDELIQLSGKCFFGPTWMIKKINGKNYRFDENVTHGEDLLFYLSISTTGDYTSTNEVIYHYREGNISAMSDLVSLETGYYTIFEKLKDLDRISNDQLDSFRKKIKSIMWKSYLANGNIVRAVKVLVK